MSAATEELLEQIFILESQIQELKNKGQNVADFEFRLLELKDKFQLMNETLKNGKNVLKG